MDNSAAEKLLQILQTGNEGIEYLERHIVDNTLDLVDWELLQDYFELLRAVEESVASTSKPNRVSDINVNMFFYIDEMIDNINNSDLNSFCYNFRFHFSSLYRILEFEIAYIIEEYVTKSDYPHFYPDTLKVDHDKVSLLSGNFKYTVSIVLLAYNNLQYTKDCLDSILCHTGDVNYELILVDNGSTDGTKEYFESIPGAKVIHLKQNIHLVKGFNIGLMAAEGKYCAAVCNDFIFTSRWLENLIECIESDPLIGFASPGATFISNMQKIPIPFISKEDFQEKAKQFNHSDPSKWEERVVLLPNVLFSPKALLEQIGYYDTRFYRGEFLDDDISFKIRRAGYKLVYCGDTVVHHYGSLTTAVDHQSNSIEEGRRTFREKYQLDAWDDARMDPAYLSIKSSTLSNVNSILGIDVKCGATLLQIKNRVWAENGNKSILTVFNSEDKYKKDLQTIADKVIGFKGYNEIPEQLINKVDLVYIEKPLDLYSDELHDIFKCLSKIMNPNGKVVFTTNNKVSIESLYNLLNGSISIHNNKIYIASAVCEEAKYHNFDLISIGNYSISRSLESEKIIENLSQSLSNGASSEVKYISSLLSCSHRLYQMQLRY
ncbi:hypothetical protein PAECIP112173_03178 [Paenibacillus sp. JJ-100]|uniref:glycosyltransferase family 2 protein n=1 Tax=Paenibacillus sp. JJ-100 TaxID=2974896 RepID=UPI0022FF8337|nr:glycosyltransferase [Paenibacillus sp. JJ-100]CAI6081312.1 hypothetical protein PAECIP112173_03178 [Paenibacillus sp. JJ-100]